MQPALDRARALRDRPGISRSGVIRHPAYPDGLSEREVEVLRLLATGKSNTEIADALVISYNTVARHVTNIFAKTNAANRTEAAAYVHRHGLADSALHRRSMRRRGRGELTGLQVDGGWSSVTVRPDQSRLIAKCCNTSHPSTDGRDAVSPRYCAMRSGPLRPTTRPSVCTST